MDVVEGLHSAEAGPTREPSVASNVNLGTGASGSTSLFRSGTDALSDKGVYHHVHSHDLQHRNHDNDDHRPGQRRQLPRLHSEPLTMADTGTQPTSFSGPSSLPEAHASGLNPTGAPPIGSTESPHRTPRKHSQSHPNLTFLNPQRNPADNKPRKPGGETSFSPPFLHPLSLRTSSRSSRTPSPLPASAQRNRTATKSKARFNVGRSPPNSPSEPEPKHGAPTRLQSPFTIRGFLALSTFTKVVTIAFACCVFVLFKAFLGVGHSAETCGVYAHEVPNPGPRPGFSSGSAIEGADPGGHTKDETPLDRGFGDEQARMRLERVEEMYGYQYDWKFGGYEFEHGDEGVDEHHDDEYEHEEFSDPA